MSKFIEKFPDNYQYSRYAETYDRLQSYITIPEDSEEHNISFDWLAERYGKGVIPSEGIPAYTFYNGENHGILTQVKTYISNNAIRILSATLQPAEGQTDFYRGGGGKDGGILVSRICIYDKIKKKIFAMADSD